jgi:hypothetical protein
MNSNKRYIIAIVLIFISVAKSSGQVSQMIKLNPSYGLKNNLKETYSGKNLLLHLSAVGITYVIVQTKIDANVLSFAANRSPKNDEIMSKLVYGGGGIVPGILPISFYLLSNNLRIKGASSAMIQATSIALVSNSLLKGITGRMHPEPLGDDYFNQSKDWSFGFMKRGIHDGWPSGHAMTNMAMGVALASYYNDRPGLQLLGLSWATFIAANVALVEKGEGHWFSDAIAGSLMGSVIGYTIGKNFRLKFESKNVVVTASQVGSGIGTNILFRI